MWSVLTSNLWHDAGPYEGLAARIRDWIDWLDPDRIGFQEASRGPIPSREALAGRGQIERCDEVMDGAWPSDPLGVYAELRSQSLAATRRAAL